MRPPARILSVLLLWVVVGCGSRECRPGTVFLKLDYPEWPPGFEVGVSVDITLGNKTERTFFPLDLTVPQDSFEIQFKSGYPKGQEITVNVTVGALLLVLARGTQKAVLEEGCSSITVALALLQGYDLGGFHFDFSAGMADAGDGLSVSVDGSTRDASIPRDGGASLNYMFVTSTTHLPGPSSAGGDFIGLAGADALCNQHAAAAGLPRGVYVAWLSTSTVDAKSRLGSARGWIRPDGLPFADSIDTLTIRQQTFYPPKINEFGNDINTDAPRVFTGTDARGLKIPDQNCLDWTAVVGGLIVGYSSAGAPFWTNGSFSSCGVAQRLYCFGIDRNVPVNVAPVGGRLAFISRSPYTPTAGVAGMDALCAADAAAAGVNGSFSAFIATTTSSAAARFDLTGSPWRRVDGVPIVRRASDLRTGSLVAPLNVDPWGEHTWYYVWTGSSTPAALGVQTCNDWTSSSESGKIGLAPETAPRFFDSGPTSCSMPAIRLYCLER